MASNLFTLIKNRRSVRKFSSKKVPSDVIQRVFDVTRWAPSAHNSQPWRFVVIDDFDTKQQLAKAMAMKWKEDLQKDGTDSVFLENFVADSVKRFSGPPVLVVVCLGMKEMDSYPDKKRRQAEYVMGTQSVGAATQNLLLAVHGEGLAACWFCAPLFCPETVRNVLGIPENVYPQALITVGYPDEVPKAPPRKPLDNILYQNRWGQ
ncbi:MAG: nitroreductase family protein [archaeon]|nr:nitroreductase family protein [Candidatus Bathyarchaeum sp.]